MLDFLLLIDSVIYCIRDGGIIESLFYSKLYVHILLF